MIQRLHHRAAEAERRRLRVHAFAGICVIVGSSRCGLRSVFRRNKPWFKPHRMGAVEISRTADPQFQFFHARYIHIERLRRPSRSYGARRPEYLAVAENLECDRSTCVRGCVVQRRSTDNAAEADIKRIEDPRIAI